RRIQFHGDHELSAVELALERRPRDLEPRIRRRCWPDNRRAKVCRRLTVRWRSRVDRLAHCRDVFWRRTAAATYHPGANLDHLRDGLRHVGRRSDIDEALADLSREAGIGLSR